MINCKIFRFLFLIYLACILFLILYCTLFTGMTNHSSFDFTKIFVCLGLIGIITGIILTACFKLKTEGVILLISGVLIIVIGILFNIFNIMIPYDLWIQRNMSGKFSGI